MLSFNLFHRLHFNQQIHFYQNTDPLQKPMWQEEKLVSWKTASAAHLSYSSLLKYCNLKWQKDTHL
jgi:hypothetical protein